MKNNFTNSGKQNRERLLNQVKKHKKGIFIKRDLTDDMICYGKKSKESK